MLPVGLRPQMPLRISSEGLWVRSAALVGVVKLSNVVPKFEFWPCLLRSSIFSRAPAGRF